MFQYYYNGYRSGQLKSSNCFFSRGSKILLALLCIEYIVPLILNIVFKPDPLFKLPLESSDTMLGVLLSICVFFLAIMLASLTPSIVPNRKVPIGPIPNWILMLFFGLCALFGGYLMLNSLSGWRYSALGLSSSEDKMLFVVILQTLLPIVCFWLLITDHRLLLSRRRNDVLLKLLIAIALITSINGLGFAIVAILFLVILLRPVFALSMLFSSKIASPKKKQAISGIVLILILLLPISIMGLSAKQNNSSAGALLSEYSSKEYWINRHSTHLAFAASSIQERGDIENLFIPINTLLFRVHYLTGLGAKVDKPELGSLNRLTVVNYANFDLTRHPRMGASPGIIASFAIVFPYEISLIFIFIFVFLLIKVTDYIFARQPELSWLGASVLAYLPFRYVTDSPLNLIVPSPISLVVLFIIIAATRRQVNRDYL